MPAGKFNPFFYKIGNGTSSIYRGSTLLGHGWAWLGDCLGRAQAAPSHQKTSCSPQICPKFINLSCFHQFFLINSDHFDEFGADLVGNRGKSCCSWLGQAQAKHAVQHLFMPRLGQTLSLSWKSRIDSYFPRPVGKAQPPSVGKRGSSCRSWLGQAQAKHAVQCLFMPRLGQTLSWSR